MKPYCNERKDRRKKDMGAQGLYDGTNFVVNNSRGQ